MIDVDPQFLAFLKNEEARAEDSDTDDRRAVAIDFYNGEPFGDEEEGRSRLVTRDVAEVVDYMTVSLLRTVVSGDRVVEFEARTKEQAQYSDDATETVTQQFMRRQKGYQLVHDWIKAGLIEITGIVKTYAEPQDKRIEAHAMRPIVLTALKEQYKAQGRKFEIVQKTDTGTFDEYGDELVDVAVMVGMPPKFCDHAVPNEEFKCAPDARDLDSAIYLAHVPPKTISDLAKMGFDAADLSELEHGSELDGTLAAARDGDIDTAVDRDGANRRVAFREEYCFYDLNGDGVAERLMVQRVGNHVLAIEEVDDHPFEEWCPFPMPHRRIGQALAEKVMDIQRTRSVVLRNTMDGFYASNKPVTYLHEDSMGDSTIEDILSPAHGKIIRWRGAFKPEERTNYFNPDSGLAMLEQMAGERESRTGITRLNQGLDADTLNKTATGTALMQAQGQQIEEYLARNFAEALARLFAKKLRIMKQYGGTQPLRVDGEFRDVDPKQWDDEMDLAVNVGLGSGKKEQRLLNRQLLLEIQAAAMDRGARIVTEEHIYNSIKGVVADAGLGNANDYVADPAQLGPPPPPGPSPEEQKMQAQMQIEAAKVQAKMQTDQAAHQLEMGKAQAKLQVEQTQAISKLQLEQARAQAEAQLAREKAQFEAQLAQAKMQFEQRLAEQKMAIDAQIQSRRADSDHEAKMAKNRAGGDLSK